MKVLFLPVIVFCSGFAQGIILDQGQLSAADAHALNQRLETEKAQRLLLQNDVEVLMRKLESLTRELDLVKGSVDPDQISKQAFMVKLSHVVTPASNQHIIYDNVLVNLGNNYDPRHGTFTAQINGTYLFAVEACSAPGHYIVLSLMKNNVDVGHVLGGDPTFHDCSSNTFIVPLVYQDDVWVQHHSTTGDHLDSTYTGNNFAGILIHPS